MSKRTLITIGFALLVAVAIAVGSFLFSKKSEPQTAPTQAYDLVDERYTAQAQQLDVKLYGTQIEDLYYSLSPIQFYHAKKGKLEPIAPQTTLEVSAAVGDAQLSFEIPVVQVEQNSFGIGVWHSDSGVYNDAFAVLQDMPEAMNSPYTYLLMIDTTRADKSASERLYSEFFAVSESGEQVQRLFDQGNRMAEQSGKLRTDWDCARLNMLGAQADSVFFLSGKKYNHSEDRQLYDLQQMTGGSTSTVAQEISGDFVAQSKGILYYSVASETGWEIFAKEGGTVKSTASFEGTFAEDYLLSSHYVLHKKSLACTDLLSGKEIKAPGAFKKLYGFAAAEDKLIYVGKEENKSGESYKVQKIVITSLKTEQSKTYYANNIMDENTSLYVGQQGIVTLKDGKSVFISYNSLESMG